MKKIITFLFLAFAISRVSFAQHYIGGSFSLSGTTSQTTLSGTRHSSSTSFTVSPDFGWFFGERWAVGFRSSVGFGSSASSRGDKTSSFSLGIEPYARYRMLDFHRFGLWAEAGPTFRYQRTRGQYPDAESGSAEQRKSHLSMYGVQLLPVLTYQLSQRISLESRLDLFSFFLTGVHSFGSDGSIQDSYSYGLKATTQDVMDTLDDISIGFIYRF